MSESEINKAMSIIGMQKLPSDDLVMGLIYKNAIEQNSFFDAVVFGYAYGVMQGKREERARHKKRGGASS